MTLSTSVPLVLGDVSAPGQDSLINYPCAFPIKVMGLQREGLTAALTQIAQQFDPLFTPDAPASVQLRQSSGGKYLSVTLTITATSRAQLDDLYRALTIHPWVKVVL